MRRLAIVALLVAVAASLYFLLDQSAGPAPEDPLPREADPAPPPEPDEATLQGAPEAGDPRASGASTEPDAPPPEAGSRWTVTGRVVDERRRPAAGAKVVLVGLPDARAGVTDPAGHFRIDAAPSPRLQHFVGVRALHEGGRAGWVSLVTSQFADGTADAGTLVLEGAADLEVEVVDPAGAPRAGATVLLQRVEWSAAVQVAEARTNAAGSVGFRGLDPHTWRVVASAEGLGRGWTVLDLRRERPEHVRVTLTAPHDLDVYVVDRKTEEPIPDATLFVLEYFLLEGQRGAVTTYEPAVDVAPTDAAGRTVISGIGAADRLQIKAEAPGYPQGLGRSRSLHGLKPGQTETTVKLLRTVSLTWEVTDDEGPPPPDGTVLELRPDPGAGAVRLPETVRMEDGRIVGEGFEATFLHAFAMAPDGRFAKLYWSEKYGVQPTAFRQARRIVVTVRYPDGSPATGYWVHARNQGNMTVAGPEPVDEDGSAVLEVFSLYQVDVMLSTVRAQYGGRAIGSLLLKEKGGAIEIEVPQERPVCLEVHIDGERRLPSRYRLYAGGGEVVDAQEEPARGELHFTIPASEDEASRRVTLMVTGREDAQAVVPLVAEGETARIRLVLHPAATLVVRARLTSGESARLQLWVWNEDAADWRREYRRGHAFLKSDPGEAEAVHRYEGLAAGRYRVTEDQTGKESDAVDLPRGDEREVVLDLSSTGWLSGTVEVPEGAKVAGARVVVEGLPEGVRAPTVYVRHDGSFKVQVPSDRDLVLRPWHPLLRPGPGSEAVTVRAPNDAVRLVLISGPVLVVTGLVPATEGGGFGLRRVGVRLFAPGQSEDVLGTCELVRDETGWRGGGVGPGTYDLWVNVQGYVPFTLPGVELTDGDNPLTLPALVRGSTVRLRVLVDEGQSPPRIYASATYQGKPRYVRYVNSRGEAEVELSGLCPGRFQLRAHPMRALGGTSGETAIDREIEVDGKSDLTFELDLRK